MGNVQFRFGLHDIARDGGLFFIFEMANNHQGSLAHGLEIIRTIGKIAQSKGINGAIKFQFRQLETFLHPGFLKSPLGVASNKHTKRFIETRLGYHEYEGMAEEARRLNLIPIATPFDEASVSWCEKLAFPVIKIASCSASDWPLLRRVAQSKLPVVCSTAGASWKQVDEVVAFFGERHVPLALMHCVAVYPAPRQQLHIDQVRQLRRRYPNLVIGYSAHESPDDLDIVPLAIASGASILERHIGVRTAKSSLNAYSLAPDEVDRWVEYALRAHIAMGAGKQRRQDENEALGLGELQRGVYAKVAKKGGEFLNPSDLMFAMPCLPGQFSAGEVDSIIGMPVPHQGIDPMMPVWKNGEGKTPPEVRVSSILERTKEMLEEAKISLAEGTAAEISHPYGLAKFDQYGAVIIDIVNREYCKKLILQLPGQDHPLHKHQQKEETFQVLNGEIEVEVDGQVRVLKPGDSLTIHRGEMHGFRTRTGMIIEEISTTHIKGDSFYHNSNIPSDPTTRKTPLHLGQS